MSSMLFLLLALHSVCLGALLPDVPASTGAPWSRASSPKSWAAPFNLSLPPAGLLPPPPLPARHLQANSAPSWALPRWGSTLSVPDLAPPGTLLLSLQAKDPDPAFSIFGQLSYSLLSVLPASGASLFSLAPATGKLRLASAPAAVWAEAAGAQEASTSLSL